MKHDRKWKKCSKEEMRGELHVNAKLIFIFKAL